MGHRLQVSIASEEHGNPVLILAANNSHPRIDLRKLVHESAKDHPHASDLAEALLALRYPSTAGRHRKGERVFWVAFSPGGDEEHLRIVCSPAEELLAKGYLKPVQKSCLMAQPVIEATVPAPESYDDRVRASYAGSEARRQLADLPPSLHCDVTEFATTGLPPQRDVITAWLASRGTSGAVDRLVNDIIRLQPVAHAATVV